MQPRRLLLVRHAQAAGGAVDAERPLTERGARQAAAIGSWLEEQRLVPERVLVSPARRAEETWERAGAQLATSPLRILDARIYDNTVEALLDTIRGTADDVATLAVVGHNPSVGELTFVLDDGEGSPTARRDADRGFPPGAVAVFTLATPFAAIAPGGATLTDLTRPGG